MDFRMIARNSSGVSAGWNCFFISEITNGVARSVTPNLINVLTPVKDLGALLWDVRVITTNVGIQIQVKGGTTNDLVGWYFWGHYSGLNYPYV